MRNCLLRRPWLFRGPIALLIGLAAASVVACEPGAPGWRDATGACVTWRGLEERCGLPPETWCTPDAPDPSSAALVATPRGDPSLPPCRGCGCKGGPGYRGPNGRCVAWKELTRICGPRLPGLCAAEEVDPRAADIAAQQNLIGAKPKRR